MQSVSVGIVQSVAAGCVKAGLGRLAADASYLSDKLELLDIY